MSTSGPAAEPASLPSIGKSIDGARFSKMHRRFWFLAGLGIMLDGFDFFIIGVANPLIKEDLGASAWQTGLVSAAAIVGAIFGAAVLGPLGDKIGRRRIFKYDLVMFVVFSVASMLAPELWSLIAARFLLGIAIGLDYPIAAAYLAEILPKQNRGRWLVSAFSLQAVGMLLGAAVGVAVLLLLPYETSWRWMLGFGIVPALLIIWLRRSVPESPRWLAQNGHEAEAIAVTEALVGHPVRVSKKDREKVEQSSEGIQALFQPQLFRKDLRRRTIFTSLPWFLMDIATYGVGIFTPTLLAALVLAGPDASFIADDIASTESTALLDIFLVLGFLSAIFLVEKIGRIPLQLIGFAMMSVGLVILATASSLPGAGNENLALVFIGFAVFNFFMNAGPNATTYALPAEVFPSEVRAAGHGFAAGAAKLGAAIGVFFFPILLDEIGQAALLFGLAGISISALVVTWVFRIETKGKGLDELSGRRISALSARPSPP
ncbi:MAG: MFS transporter [Candidatus Nanopelagicales bacterium]